jgi:hypothetical protein
MKLENVLKEEGEGERSSCPHQARLQEGWRRWRQGLKWSHGQHANGRPLLSLLVPGLSSVLQHTSPSEGSQNYRVKDPSCPFMTEVIWAGGTGNESYLRR